MHSASEEQNLALAREFIERHNTNTSAWVELCTEDVRWEELPTRHSPKGRSFAGRAELAAAIDAQAGTGIAVEMLPRSFLADGDRVVIEADLIVRLRGKQVEAMRYAGMLTFQDGRIAFATDYLVALPG